MATTITVAPATATLQSAQTQAFSATVRDQFGTTISNAAVTWTATGGTISSSGLYTAGATAGSFTATATSGAAAGSATITINTPAGTFLLKWGSQGSANGQLSSPRDVAVDASGNVYVADTNNHRIQKFTGQ